MQNLEEINVLRITLDSQIEDLEQHFETAHINYLQVSRSLSMRRSVDLDRQEGERGTEFFRCRFELIAHRECVKTAIAGRKPQILPSQTQLVGFMFQPANVLAYEHVLNVVARIFLRGYGEEHL